MSSCADWPQLALANAFILDHTHSFALMRHLTDGKRSSKLRLHLIVDPPLFEG